MSGGTVDGLSLGLLLSPRTCIKLRLRRSEMMSTYQNLAERPEHSSIAIKSLAGRGP